MRFPFRFWPKPVAAAVALTLSLPFVATVLPAVAQTNLPELGDSSGALVTGQQERKLGAEAMREIRASGAWLNDPEVNAYLNDLGRRILDANPTIRDKFEFFAMGDPGSTPSPCPVATSASTSAWCC